MFILQEKFHTRRSPTTI